MEPLLIASDLDRTVLPNGEQVESPQARSLLRQLVSQPEVTLAYVSGRTKSLLKSAISEYDLPIPDYAIGDVGTTIYEVGEQESWKPIQAWQDAIAPDWKGYTWDDLKALFNSIEEMWLQDEDPAFQSTFKLSYYTDPGVERDRLIQKLESISEPLGIKAAYIWSIDEERNIGLLDVLPRSATKLHAIEFLQKTHLDFPRDRVVFVGDSGNDLPALSSGLKAVVVHNARQEVKDEALALVTAKGMKDSLYIAQGGFLDMNGNYSAGVLEGVVHFFPEVEGVLR